MILSISHHTTYTFNSPVFLEPHYLRFRPQFRHYFKVLSYDIQIDPLPGGLSHRLSEENNIIHQVWFSEKLDEINFDVRLEIETNAFNPYDFFIDPNLTKQEEVLRPYLSTSLSDSEMNSWLEEFFAASSDDLDFILKLTALIKSDWYYSERYEPNIMTPEYCFREKKGSCRDLSWMMIQLLRKRQIPARFTSGYSYNPELGEGHELHAWVEAWLPGAGWIGLDPATGLMTSHYYIPVATSCEPSNTLPVTGNYRGDASSDLAARVLIRSADQ